MTEGAFWNNYKGTAIPASGSTISSPNASGTNVGYRGTAGTTNVAADPFIADLLAMSDQDRLLVSELLVKAGYLRTPTRKYNKKLGDAYQTASNDWQVESARTGRAGFTFRQFLQENAAAPAGGAANIPTRQIYDVPKIQIEDDVNAMAQNILGRTITDADKQQDWYNDLIKGINKMYQSGTLTTVKNVRNKKTGKMEKQVIQEPGFSKEKITERITTTLEQADPMAVERKKNLEFANWAIQKMGGGR